MLRELGLIVFYDTISIIQIPQFSLHHLFVLKRIEAKRELHRPKLQDNYTLSVSISNNTSIYEDSDGLE